MDFKVCKVCKETKPLFEFYRNGLFYRALCKPCLRKHKGPKKYHLSYYQRNKDKVKISNRKWELQNREKVKQAKQEYCEKNKEKMAEYRKQYYKNNKQQQLEKVWKYRKEHREEIKARRRLDYKVNRDKYIKYKKAAAPRRRELEKHKRKTNLQWKFSQNFRLRIRTAIKKQKGKKSMRTEKLIGCSVDFLRNYLESKFTPEMSWKNYGSYWHIDHIKPLSRFDLTKETQQLEAFNYKNLQPLEARENIKKGNKWEEPC